MPFHLVSGELSITEWAAGEPRVSGVLAKPFRPEALLALLPTASAS